MKNELIRILFYAINGVGLGHVARLSVISKYITDTFQNSKINFYSNSPFASDFFGCQGDTLFIPNEVELSERKKLILSSFNEAAERYQPHIVVCDTYWPVPAINLLKKQGVRTVLIVRLISVSRACETLKSALEDFDLIIIPHLIEEIHALYGNDSQLVELIRHPKILISGPVARISSKVSKKNVSQVLFSLGGGGEYDRPKSSNTIESMKNIMYKTCEELIRKGIKCFFARGPFLPDLKQLENWNILETLSLQEFINESTVMVSRAGYNTCWETLGAGGRLLLIGDHVGFEDVEKRGNFLEELGLAINTQNKLDDLADIVYREITQGWDSKLIQLKASVNIGLDNIVKQIMNF